MKIRKAKKEDARKIHLLRKKTFEKINSKDYSKEIIEVLNKKNSPKAIIEKMQKREMFCLTEKNKILGTIDLEGNKVGGLFIRWN